MSRIGHNFAAAGELPIPEDVQVTSLWPPLLVEMAAHLGPYCTLLLADALGGRRIYIPADADRGKSYDGIGSLTDILGSAGARILSDIYGREYLDLPKARAALAEARRGPIIAQIRAGEMTVAEGAIRLDTTRQNLSRLINRGDQAQLGGTARRIAGAAGQLDMFGED